MDWNNDCRVNAYDYAHYKSVIETGSNLSNGNSYSVNSTGTKWVIVLILTFLVLKLMGLD